MSGRVNSPAPVATSRGTAPSASKPTYADLGILADKPKRADMAALQTRVASFQNALWKNSKHAHTPNELAEAGLFYAGYEDCARCFMCGMGYKRWEPCDNPWIIQAIWAPGCAYVRMVKGAVFVEIVQRMHRNKEEIALKAVEKEVAQITNANAGAKFVALRARPSVTVDVRQLEIENEELKSQVTCKICMDEKISVVFLPCGHIVACTGCAPALKKCPLCRAEILGSTVALLE